MSANARDRPDPDNIELDTFIDTSGDAVTLPAWTGPTVMESPYGDYVVVEAAFEATEGKYRVGIENQGVDLEMSYFHIATSQGAENNRMWGTLGYAPTDSPGIQLGERIITNLGIPPGGSWSRGSGRISWENDAGAKPFLGYQETVYALMDMSNPNNTDTTKGYMSLFMEPFEGEPGI